MQKIKSFIESDRGKDILVVFVVILVGFGSFGLGRLSKDSSRPGIVLEYQQSAQIAAEKGPASPVLAVEEPKEPIETPKSKSTSGAFFASNRGSKYYHLGCTGGKTLKKENLVYFSSEAEAISAGYEKSTSCK